MTEAPSMSEFSADRPLVDPALDRLGYAPFARHVASCLALSDPRDGLVVALYGQWGCGKTTVINFIRHYLKEEHAGRSCPVSVFFNPWWFSSDEDLLRAFFVALSTSLSKDLAKKKRLKDAIGNLLELASHVPIHGASGLKVVGDALRREKTIPGLKEEISAFLRKEKVRLLVIIDDLDRLAPSEIRQVFRIVKSVCDFQNVTYLLAFDRDAVAQALGSEVRVPGRTYLEKIVQIPFDIPLPDKAALRGMLFERLNVLLAETPEDLFERQRWSSVYLEGIDPLITLPRHIVRLVNALKLSYPSVRDEVNAVDFIGVEALRVFCPPVYEVLRSRPDAFVGGRFVGFATEIGREKQKEFHEKLLSQLEEGQRKAIERGDWSVSSSRWSTVSSRAIRTDRASRRAGGGLSGFAVRMCSPRISG